MPASDNLLTIINRILSNHHTEADLEELSLAISVKSSQDILQIGKYNVNISEGKDIHIGDRIIHNNIYPKEKPANPVKYIPYTGVRHFVARTNELTNLHEKLQQPRTVAISTVVGMGGVGKTELAIKYAREHEVDYPGGICWLNAREGNLDAQIVQFTQRYMNLEVPQKLGEKLLSLAEQVAWCWQNWQPSEGLVLVIFDDVTDLKSISEVLPRNYNRFRVLITTRLRQLDNNFIETSLHELLEEEALQQLTAILGEEDRRIQRELQTAKDLCKWLGCLPLGIELVGRYLAEDPDLSFAEMLQELQEKRLQNSAIAPSEEQLQSIEITGKLGVQAAFDLSWQKLDAMTRRMGELLSLFFPDAITWELVVSISQQLNWEKEEVNNAKKNLYKYHFIQRLCLEKISYKIHPLVREFLLLQLAKSKYKENYKEKFFAVLVSKIQNIPQSPNRECIKLASPIIPHLEEVANNWIISVGDEDLIEVFVGLGRFYFGQGLYALAEHYYQQFLSTVRVRFGDKHSFVALSLTCLAYLYSYTGRYEESKILNKQALTLCQSLLGDNHPLVAVNFNNLAGVYSSMGYYAESEKLYNQALDIYKCLFGQNHQDVATCLNGLAHLYFLTERHTEAEPLLKQVVEIRKNLLGEEHPDFAQSLNNLGTLFYSQGRYDEAKTYLEQAFDINKHLLGNDHPNIADNLSNLANLYFSLSQFSQSEQLYLQALELKKRFFGNNHPDVALCLQNLGLLYQYQEYYSEAESLYIQAWGIYLQVLGQDHPKTQKIANSLALVHAEMGKHNL